MLEANSFITVEQYRALQRDPVVPPRPEQLFDYIVETLAARRLMSYAAADPFRARIPSGLFLLIPPKPKGRPLEELLSLIDSSAGCGRCYLQDRDLHDTVAVPRGTYLMTDVEDGQQVCGRTGADGEGRLPFLLWEGIIHAVLFPLVFQSHDLVLAGTEYGSGAVPTLCLNGGQPELRGYWYGFEGYPRRGVPTCALRVGLPSAVSAAASTGD